MTHLEVPHEHQGLLDLNASVEQKGMPCMGSGIVIQLLALLCTLVDSK